MTKSFNEMSLSEMVAAYNAMVAENTAYMATGSGSVLSMFKPTTKFKDRPTGIKRCEAIAKALQAHQAEVSATPLAAADVVHAPATRVEKPASANTKHSQDRASTKHFGVVTVPANPNQPKEGEEVAKKTTAKKPAPKSNGKTAKPGEFSVRPGSNREKLFARMKTNLGKFVPEKELVATVYGRNGGSSGLLREVMKGVMLVIEAQKLPFEVRKEKDRNGISYGLFKA